MRHGQLFTRKSLALINKNIKVYYSRSVFKFAHSAQSALYPKANAEKRARRKLGFDFYNGVIEIILLYVAPRFCY